MATLKMGTTTVLTDTTLANAVQDNVTRLGTVTAGTLSHGTLLQGYVDSSNTGVTFPSGHIIQFFKAGTVGENINATTEYVEIFPDSSITPRKTGSRIVSITDIAGISLLNNSNQTMTFRITDGAGSQRLKLSTHMLYQTHGSTSEPGRFHASWTSDLGTSTTAGTAFPVNVDFKCNNNTGIVRVGVDSDPSNLWLMEVTV